MPKRARDCCSMSGVVLEELKLARKQEEYMWLKEVDARRKVEEWRQKCRDMLAKEKFILKKEVKEI